MQVSAFWRNASMWRAYLKISRHLDFFLRDFGGRAVNWWICSYHRSQHAMLLLVCVLSNLVLFNLISSAIVDDLVIIYFFYFPLYSRTCLGRPLVWATTRLGRPQSLAWIVSKIKYLA